MRFTDSKSDLMDLIKS